MNDWRMYTDTNGQDQNHVAWHEVLRAIAQLNGTSHTMVHAAYGDHVDLVVSGGDQGKVLVQWKEYDRTPLHYVLSRKNSNGVMASLTIEGETIPVPMGWCLPLEQVVPICGDILRTCEIKTYDELEWIVIDQE